jgi:polysaccharide chain length determinant protein (PEP-CTERM system associated)
VLPGKKYSPEDYLFAAWRRKWVLILPIVLFSGAAFLYARSLPDQYRSEARVLVLPQQVPESYVKSTVTSTLSDRLQVMSQQIMSRARLERIIQEFNLYPEERKTSIMQDVVDQMRARDIHIDVPRVRGRQDPTFFSISFDATNARTAMQVTERLTSLFVEENRQDRSLLSQQTSAFLDAQLEQARVKLSQQAQQLEAFRSANSGTLPEQAQSALAQIQTTQTRLQAVNDAIARDHDRSLVLDQLMAGVSSMPAPPRPVNPSEPSTASTPGEQLAAARSALASLEQRLTPEHPDVLRMKRTIADLEKKVESEAANTPLGAIEPSGPSVPIAQQQQLLQMRAERESIQRRLANEATEQKQLENTLAQYQQRLELIPKNEVQLAQLTRDYDTLQENYRNLLAQSERAKVAADLERREIGQQFRIVDSARLPERPMGPNRLRIEGMGTGAGVAIGILLIALLEYKDSSFHTRDDIVTVLALPVLAVVPRMITTPERRRIRRRKIYGLAATAVFVIAAAAVSAWKLRLLDGWVR